MLNMESGPTELFRDNRNIVAILREERPALHSIPCGKQTMGYLMDQRAGVSSDKYRLPAGLQHAKHLFG